MLGSVALAVGFIDAAAGGGMLVMPALMSIGMPPHLVVGTNKLVGNFGTSSASVTFIRQRRFRPALWWAMSFGTGVGALLGGWWGTKYPRETKPDVRRARKSSTLNSISF